MHDRLASQTGEAHGRLRIGTSGWSYEHWKGRFYPDGLPSAEWLTYYAGHFPTVEINASFYRMPSEKMVVAWRDRTPPEFRFAAKGSRFVTHFRRLKDTSASVESFVSRMRLLGDKLGVVLWQLPADVKLDARLLDEFLSLMPSDVRTAVEFRDESWLVDAAYDVLRGHNAAHVHVSSDIMPMDLTTTSDFVYARFHGLAGYHGAYVERALESWADFLAEQLSLGRDAFVYFNNDAEAHAPSDAGRLRRMVERRTGGAGDSVAPAKENRPDGPR